jgi:hypothetical protein
MQQHCPRCNQEFDPGPWKRRYCSRSCANSRTFTAEARLKKSLALRGRSRSSDYDTDAWRSQVQQRWREKAQSTPWEELSLHRKRELVKYEQGYACGVCGIEQWRDQPVVLKVAHFDRNPLNLDRANLRAVCANCFSQL